ncbi:MAG: hypothetical protein GX352_10160 [Clostridiales bacterium]|nr:hypothetical protein [Clostridiales bacterium]
MYLLGVDLGTTGCKSMVFDLEGNILGSYYIEYELIFTPEGVEQDANAWWNNTKTAVKGALEEAGIDGEKVLSVSVSSQGIAFVPVDKEGNTLMNAISWYDARAVDEVARIKEDYDNFEIFSRTGRQITPVVFPKVMWLKKNRPEIYEKASTFLMGLDFLLYRFSGNTTTDYTMASGTLCYDTAKREWIPELFERYGIDMDRFPQIHCFGDVVGTVLPEVAEELGLSTKTKVVMGLQDQKAGASGAGINEEIMTISLGTASAISSIAKRHVTDDNMAVACHGFDRNRWMLENNVGTAGSALKWVRDTLFSQKSYREMDALAEKAPVGSNGVIFHPFLVRGESGHGKGTFARIALDATQGDIIRSVLEGIAYEIKICIDAHKRVSDIARKAKELHVFGGGAVSSLWCQIIADIANMPVVIPRTYETGNLGAALCAGIGAGVFKNLDDAKAFVGKPQKEYLPNKENSKAYKEKFEEYTEWKRNSNH